MTLRSLALLAILLRVSIALAFAAAAIFCLWLCLFLAAVPTPWATPETLADAYMVRFFSVCAFIAFLACFACAGCVAAHERVREWFS